MLAGRLCCLVGAEQAVASMGVAGMRNPDGKNRKWAARQIE